MDSALTHISEIIQLEDVPSIQMEVGVLVREFPDVRYEPVHPDLLFLMDGWMDGSVGLLVDKENDRDPEHQPKLMGGPDDEDEAHVGLQFPSEAKVAP